METSASNQTKTPDKLVPEPRKQPIEGIPEPRTEEDSILASNQTSVFSGTEASASQTADAIKVIRDFADIKSESLFPQDLLARVLGNLVLADEALIKKAIDDSQNELESTFIDENGVFNKAGFVRSVTNPINKSPDYGRYNALTVLLTSQRASIEMSEEKKAILVTATRLAMIGLAKELKIIT